MKFKILKKFLPIALSLVLALSLLAGCGGSSNKNNPDAPPSVDPPVTAGAFVDNYKNNVSANTSPSNNPVLALLSGFLQIWTPGSAWNNGTIVNNTVQEQNIQKSIDATINRDSGAAAAAYYDDRRNQNYSIIEGLGPYAGAYLSLSGAYTTITNIPADATTQKYDDGGNGAGTSSIASLIGVLRGSYSSTTPPKNYYQYPRPWRQSTRVIIVPELVPCKSATPESDGGFPSGHTNAGYLAALAMAYAVPERFQELLTRASELGDNRIVAGMHSPLDVMGGRMMATALAAAILNDPATSVAKENAFNFARTQLLTGPANSPDRFSNYAMNKTNYTRRLTYNFSPINGTGKPMLVAKGAEVLLESRLPYLDATQRRQVLYTTGLPSGYPLLDDAEGWGRLNLFAAADGYGALLSDTVVNMDASRGGFNALDCWRNDISGIGKLIKQGTGTLKLAGNNSYSGGTQIDGGTIQADSATALGTAGVTVNSGTLANNGSGLTISGKLTITTNGTLLLNLNNGVGTLNVNGPVALGGKLQLRFLNNYLPILNTPVTIITGANCSGQFNAIETEGLSSAYSASLIYNANSVQLKVAAK
jgi:autotransporter-associated beta strand protein